MIPKRYTLAHRILHWLIAFVFLFILLTVILRQHWMNKDHIAAILQNRLSERGIRLSEADAVMIGKSVRAPMWQWHVYAGYVLLFLYVVRMVLLRVQGAVFYSPFKKGIALKERTKSAIYLLFYICFGLSLLTGIVMVWGNRDWHTLRNVAKTIHVQALYYAVTFVVLHLLGLVLGELGSHKGVISRMVHGS